MSKSIEIVSVTYRRGKKGERELVAFDDFEINRPNPDDWPGGLPLYDWRNDQIDSWPQATYCGSGAYLDLPEDWFGLRFAFFGQFFEGEQSGLSWERENVGAEGVFGDYVEKLKALGDSLLDGKVPFDRGRPREVTFLTAWAYRVSTDWEGECDVDYSLLGLVDLSKVEALIVKAKEVSA
jgi:hypothetical protein